MSTLKVGEIKHENFTGTTQLKLDNSGRLLLGTTTEGVGGADNFTIAGSGDSGMTIRSGTSSTGGLYFSDGTSGADEYRGVISYNQASNYMRFYTDASERLRIDSSGRVLIGHSSNFSGYALQVLGGDEENSSLSLARFKANASSSVLEFNKSRNNGIGSNTVVQNNDAVGVIRFKAADGTDFSQVADIQAAIDGTPGDNDTPGRLAFSTTADGSQYTTERMRIDSSGRLLLGTTSNTSTGVGSSKLQISGTGADTAGLNLIRTSNDGGGAYLQFTKNRGGATQSGDNCGAIAWMGHDGTDVNSYLATIKVEAGATATSNTMRGDIIFETADGGSVTSERMRIDSSGFVGIGQGSSYDPGVPLEVRNPVGTTPSSGVLNLLRLCAQHNSARGLDIGTGRPTSGNQNDGGVFYNARDTENSGYSAQHVFQRAGNNVMVIGYAGGNTVGIGTDYPLYKIDCHHSGANQSNAAVSRFRQLTNNQGQDHACIIVRHAAARSGQNGVGLIFQNDGGSNVGRIDIGQSTTGYETSSDYRLKENVEAISDGITRLKTLKPYRFNWIAEKGQPKVDGFFAHEVTSAVPEAISGTKDEVETTYYEKGDTIPDGKAVGDVKSTTSPVYQGIDQSKLVPLLTAALQEAVGKIEVLETKVAALEAA